MRPARGTGLRRLAVGALLALCGLGAGLPYGGAAAAPNFVVFMTDDMDKASLAAMPNVRRLVGEAGTTLDRFYVSVSLCCPSRATFLTGKYAHNTRVLSNGGGNGGHARFKAAGNERSTIAFWLSSAGYRTALIGKYLNGYPVRTAGPTSRTAGPIGRCRSWAAKPRSTTTP